MGADEEFEVAVEPLKEGEGLDKVVKEEGEVAEHPGGIPTPMKELVFNLPLNMGVIRLNYISSLMGCCILWGLAIWCIVEPDGALARMSIWRYLVSDAFCFFLIGTRIFFLFFAVYVVVKYGDIKMGGPDAVPDFDDFSYYAMLFAAGVENSLWYMSMVEAFYQANFGHRYVASGYRTQDELAIYGLTQVLSSWGLSGWTNYTPLAVAIGLAAHRFGLPLTLRAGLYPILGDYAWGWIGDCIDGLSVISTVIGICSSLALGVSQILEALRRLGWVSDDGTADDDTDTKLIIIAVVTLCATGSVVVGLEKGIKNLSNLALTCGFLLLFWVFAMEKTNYLLNLLIQVIGYYLQYLIEWTTYTGAFAQLEVGEGRATDGLSSASWWMEEWATFFMAWWGTWAPFVGLFVARVSRGRSVGQVVMFSVIAPVMYVFIFVLILAGIAFRQDRQATELQILGENLFNDTAHYLHPGSDLCYDVPPDDIIGADGFPIFTNTVPGVTPVCNFDYVNDQAVWFNIMASFTFPGDFEFGYATFLTFWSLLTITAYFVTTSDSGSLVVDTIASNGSEQHHTLQRIFWAFTEGAVCMGLVSAGGNSFSALQATLVPLGLPMNLMAVYMMQSCLAYCEYARNNPDTYTVENLKGDVRDFNTPVYGGIFNIGEYIFSLGRVNEHFKSKGMDLPKMSHITGFIMSSFLPFVSLHRILDKMYPRNHTTNKVTTFVYFSMFLLWVALFITSGFAPGIKVFAWTGFLICGVVLAWVKKSFRDTYKISGYPFGDLLSSTFLYPQVLVQLAEECDALGLPLDKADEDLVMAAEEEEAAKA